jgi:hypothetical protein
MTDFEIRRAVLTALRGDERLSSQPAKVLFEHDWVTLKGRVQASRRTLAKQSHESTASGDVGNLQ